MKRVGMITIYRKNYGAFLQAYALQQSLIKCGFCPEIIRYDYYKDHTIFEVPFASHTSFKTILKAAIVETVRFVSHRKRQIIFDKSIKKNLIEGKEYFKTYKKLEENPPQYDAYLVGSDQVFNGAISPQALPARLLLFVNNNGIKASYAASAGKNYIQKEYEDKIQNALMSFNHLSVREEGLSYFLKEKYEIESSVHIDPVFLLSKDEWDSFSEPIDYLPDKYIFYYRVLPQKELNELTEKMSRELGIPVFVADGHDKFSNMIKRKGFLSPEQWVYAISHATHVITNSFHGTSFALNFKKSLSVLVPPTGGERVLNILQKTDLKNLIANDTFSNDLNVYESASDYIEKEKKRSLSYLLKMFDANF